jgi:uncharacterized protein (TIGR02284 family)
MFKSEPEIALNDVIEACTYVADQYGEIADSVEDAELQRTLMQLSRSRRGFSQELERHAQRMGELPKAPDADLETVDRLVTVLLGRLAPEENDPMVKRCLEFESRLSERTKEALEQDLPEETLEVLSRLLESSREARKRLEAR